MENNINTRSAIWPEDNTFGIKISIIIPTLNAEKDIAPLIEALRTQTVKPDEIIIVDSESDDRTAEIVAGYGDAILIRIKRKDFNHALTRDMALRRSTGDYVIFMTQDAVPSKNTLIERLIYPFTLDEKIAISTARQLPRKNASFSESLIRNYSYPSISSIRSVLDIPKLGIRTFFNVSDCCCAYRRDIFLELGGFDFPVTTDEDFLFAARVINSGYKISYTADAEVIHSHSFTLKQQYRRNFLIGYELEKHKDILSGVSQEKEGMKMVKYVSLELLKHGRIFSFVRFGFDCMARLIGNKMGKRAYRKDKYMNGELSTKSER